MSQNDPQWGGGRNKGNNGGPPDLEDIFRSITDKFNRLVGGKGSPSNPSSMNGNGGSTGALVIAAGLFVLWVGSGVYVVDERENAVITRFGKYTKTVENAGLNWHLPYPIESREIVNVTELRSLEVGVRGAAAAGDESTMLTGDQNIIEVQLEVQYNLNSARDFLFNNRLTDKDGRDVVKQAAETAIREVVGKNKVDYVLNEGRGKIGEDTKEMIQELLTKYQTGISVSRVNISDVQPPEQVQAAFSDAVKARQDRARLINEGTAYANDVVPKASGMAARLNEEALGYRQQVVARAEGDASRFRQIAAEYAKAPQVTRDRMYLDTMQTVYQNTTKVMVDQKANGNLLYLPLDKLMQMNAQGESPAPAPAVKAAVEAPAPQPNETPAARNDRGQRDGR
ncbi:FtsH protease activity modulator HflK [Chitinibacter fontanus]|uniref:Protein HflK n=1 Tax=Chitinibacter fontanus TaxID=1737446 RepID=A0A7D5VBY4_9NEIS|nr:FtsH protease activity modulator HflK [Chitinibacter fontanus]QLI82792.1 FtsH protease activity modulator HflK [Chitinibacter fontanus]